MGERRRNVASIASRRIVRKSNRRAAFAPADTSRIQIVVIQIIIWIINVGHLTLIVFVSARRCRNAAKECALATIQRRNKVTSPRKPSGKNTFLVDTIVGFDRRQNIFDKRHIDAAALVEPAHLTKNLSIFCCVRVN